MRPGLTLLSGTRNDLRGFAQELVHDTLHRGAGSAPHAAEGMVLWCDGEHGFDPYHFAETNLERGYAADDGADRVLIKRCMTPFQWDFVLTQHLEKKLHEVEAHLVLVAPFDRLFSTDELQDWEQEDHTRFALRHLHGLARRHQVPILLTVDMGRWWRTHPVLAQATYEAVQDRWSITCPDGRFRAVHETTGTVVDPWLRRQVTLLDFVHGPMPLARVPSPRGAAGRGAEG